MQEQNRVKKDSGIYKILNKTNNKVYIGSSSQLHKRFIKHKNDLDGNRHINRHLQSSYNRYGRDCFVFFVLKECDKIDFLKQEQYFANKYLANMPETGYNKRIIVESNRGYSFKMPESAKETLRLLGKKRGKTEEFRKRMSKLHKGKTVSAKTRKRSSDSHKGIKMSESAKKKLSRTNSVKILNVETGETYKNSKECAKQLGISSATLFNWFSGKHKPKVKLKQIRINLPT